MVKGSDDAAILERHLVARAQVVDALPDVNVAVAHTRGRHADQDLGPLGLGRGAVHALERGAVLGHAVTGVGHRVLPRLLPCLLPRLGGVNLASPVNRGTRWPATQLPRGR